MQSQLVFKDRPKKRYFLQASLKKYRIEELILMQIKRIIM